MVSSRTASAPPQKKCKKKGLPHYLMRQPLYIKKTPRTRGRCGVPLMRGESGSDAKCEVGVKCYAYAG